MKKIFVAELLITYLVILIVGVGIFIKYGFAESAAITICLILLNDIKFSVNNGAINE